ncbi:hypothetical protein, partial [Brucella sp. 09RB8918]|uniref:hypothetical protein n=1 Tax=Brucella sp. 09RB8918 TaxID=1844048 RepID=UPI0019D5E40A
SCDSHRDIQLGQPNRSINLKYCNNSYDLPLPSWAQPDDVWVHDSGMFVMTKMRHPDWADQDHEFQPVLFQCTAMPEGIRDRDHDYFVESEIGLNWRKPLSQFERQEPIKIELVSINPAVLSLYERIPAQQILFRSLYQSASRPALKSSASHPTRPLGS